MDILVNNPTSKLKGNMVNSRVLHLETNSPTKPPNTARNGSGMLQKLIGKSPTTKASSPESKFSQMSISGPPRVPKQRNSPELFNNFLGRSKSGSSQGSVESISSRASSQEPIHTLGEKYGEVSPAIVGFGASAKVKMLVSHKNNNTVYAVKEFRKKRKDESQKTYMKKMTSEFCISSSLDNEHIVKTVDLVVNDKHDWCVIMEFCPGGTLLEILKEYALPLSETNCCFKQLLTGVHYLHSVGVAHRDLKPGIIILI